MAINIHPADALIHRLLQQQGNSSSQHRASLQQKPDSAATEKVTISDQARSAIRNEKPTGSLESNLFQLYGPQAG